MLIVRRHPLRRSRRGVPAERSQLAQEHSVPVMVYAVERGPAPRRGGADPGARQPEPGGRDHGARAPRPPAPRGSGGAPRDRGDRRSRRSCSSPSRCRAEALQREGLDREPPADRHVGARAGLGRARHRRDALPRAARQRGRLHGGPLRRGRGVRADGAARWTPSTATRWSSKMPHAQRATVLKGEYTSGQLLSLIGHFDFARGHAPALPDLRRAPAACRSWRCPTPSKVAGFLEDLEIAHAAARSRSTRAA